MALGTKIYKMFGVPVLRGPAPPKGFDPFKPPPTAPPAGTYDPMLDAQLRGAQRGYGDLQQDTEQSTERNQGDYAVATADATRSRERSLADAMRGKARGTEDLTTGRDRSLADILRSRAREGQDYSTDREARGRRYTELGAQQGEQATQAGVTRGGALGASLAARTANQGFEQGAADTVHQRFGEDSSRGEQQLGEDFARATQRLGEDYDTSTGRTREDYDSPDTGIFAKLQSAYQRGQDDLGTQLGRAGRELSFYGQDIGEAKFAQAAQSGYTPPTRPANEFSDARGPYRLIIRGKQRIKLRPNGAEESAGTRR